MLASILMTATSWAFAASMSSILTVAICSEPAAVCRLGDTRSCLGPGQCAGAQMCLESGAGFGHCDCGARKEAEATTDSSFRLDGGDLAQTTKSQRESAASEDAQASAECRAYSGEIQEACFGAVRAATSEPEQQAIALKACELQSVLILRRCSEDPSQVSRATDECTRARSQAEALSNIASLGKTENVEGVIASSSMAKFHGQELLRRMKSKASNDWPEILNRTSSLGKARLLEKCGKKEKRAESAVEKRCRIYIAGGDLSETDRCDEECEFEESLGRSKSSCMSSCRRTFRANVLRCAREWEP